VVPLIIAIVAILVAGGGFYWYKQVDQRKTGSTLEKEPKITSISTNQTTVGSLITIKGTNLLDTKGDQDVAIKNHLGEVAYFDGFGNPIRDNLGNIEFSVKINDKLCKKRSTDAGLPCNSWMTITPGTYDVFVVRGLSNSIQSNVVTLTIISETNCVPEGGQYGAPRSNKDLCCPGLIQQPSSESPSGTWGTCIKSANQILNETKDWKTYTKDTLGISFKYPSSWIHKKFSYNVDGEAFCPNLPEYGDCDVNSGPANQSSAPIVYYFYEGDSKSATIELMKSYFKLWDHKYENIYDKMLSTFKFTN
jgi:hypothetical protein